MDADITVSGGYLHVPDFEDAAGWGKESGIGIGVGVAGGVNLIEACDAEGNVIGEGKMYYGGVGLVGVEAHVGATYTFSVKQFWAMLDTNKD